MRGPDGQTPAWLDRELDGDGRVDGRVLDAEGQPVGHAEVVIDSAPPRTIETRADGTFSFTGLSRRTYVLTASSGDQLAGPISYPVSVPAGMPVVLRLGAAASVEVSVVDESGLPIPGARVQIRVGASGVHEWRTGHGGVVRLAPVIPGWVGVEVSAPGFAPSVATVSLGAPGASGRLFVTLRRGQTISGVVVDEAGNPISGARVVAIGEDHNMYESLSTNSGGDGRFELGPLASQRYTVRAVDGDHAPGQSPVVSVTTASVRDVRVEMRSGGRLRGTVVDAEGQPVKFAHVAVFDSEIRSLPPEWRRATTDVDGTFEVRGLVRRRLNVTAESPSATSRATAVDLTSVAEREVELILEIDGEISGVVVDDIGAPVPSAQIVIRPAPASPEEAARLGTAMSSRFTMSGADGRFTARGLTAGAQRVVASWRSGGLAAFGEGQAGVTARTGDHDVRLLLSRPGTVTGRLVLDSGAAPGAIEVVLGDQLPSPAPDGAFTLQDVAPGTYALVIRGAGFADLSITGISVTPGGITNLGTLTATRGRTLRGRVVDELGVPVAGAEVRSGVGPGGTPPRSRSLFDALGKQRSTVTGADGSFELVGLSSVPATVVAFEQRLGASEAVITAGGDQDPEPVTLRLGRTSDIDRLNDE